VTTLAIPQAFASTSRTGIAVVATLLAGYALSLVFEEPLLYVIGLLTLLLLVLAFTDLSLAVVVLPLALMNPYMLKETGTRVLTSEIALIVVFIAWLVRQISSVHGRRFPREFVLPAGLFIGAAIVSLLGATYPGAGALQVVRYIEILVVLFLLVVQEIDSVDRMRQVTVTIMLGGLIATLIGIGEFVMETSTTGSAVRIRGWHGGGFGAVAAVTFLIAGSAAILDRVPRVRLLGLCTIPLAGTALVLSGTRAWIGACGIAVITLMLLLRGPVLRRVVVGVLLVLTIGLVVLGSGLLGRQEWNIVGGVVENTLRSAPKQGRLSGEDLSLMMRFYLWYRSGGLFLEHPLTGIGAGNLRFDNMFTAHLSAPKATAGFVDNQYIQSFVELGIVGGMAWLMLMAWMLRAGARAVKTAASTPLGFVAAGLFGSLVVFAVGSFFWVLTPAHELFSLMLLCLGLTVNIPGVVSRLPAGDPKA
jgi:putative inorganic carbon (hco3(-)) transporter